MPTVNDKIEELGRLVEQFKKSNNQEDKQKETKGHADPLASEVTDRLNDEISKLQQEIKGMKTEMARKDHDFAAAKQQEIETKEGVSEKEYKAAWNMAMRKGNDTELKALSVQSDPDGGYLVPDAVSSRIIEKEYETLMMRQLASVETISTDELEFIVDRDEAGSGWVGETQSRTETTTPQIEKLVIPVHELYAEPKATQKFLDDASINVESWLANKVSEKFIRDEAAAFVSGNGVLKPKGILSYTAGTSWGQIEQVNSGNASLLTADGMIDLFYSLKSMYRQNANWIMERQSVKAIRKFKDSQGQYLWAPSLTAGEPDMFLGKPIQEGDEMPTVAASALPVAFGDFRKGYTIVDRIGIRTIRDIYTAKPYVKFYTTKRVGGGVVDFDAIKLQVVSA